jgi:hypothetical protein
MRITILINDIQVDYYLKQVPDVSERVTGIQIFSAVGCTMA